MFTHHPESPAPDALAQPGVGALLGAAIDGPGAAPAAESIPDRIACEETALLYRLTPLPLLAGLGFVAVVVAMLGPSVPLGTMVAWVATMLLLTWLRVTESRRFGSDPQRQARIRHWRLRYLAFMVVYCLAWSAIVLVFGRYATGLAYAVLLAGLVAVASVGVFTTSSVLPASGCFLGTLLLPSVLWFLWQGDAQSLGIAAGGGLFAAVLAFEAWRSHTRQTEMLRLRMEMAAVADERARALVLAEQASQARRHLLAGLSHDMRTPLNGIIGMSEIIRDEATSELQRQRAAVVLRSAEVLHRVIGDLLDYSARELDRLRVQPATSEPEPERMVRKDPSRARTVPQLQGKVLVVDDNEVNALVAQAMLARMGLQADRASDGEEALAALAQQRYDAVLMDCRMPVLDGWAATRRWRRQEAGPRRLPIIAVSANVSEDDQRHCLDCGMDAFLGKPFQIAELAAVLEPHLSTA